MSYAIWVLLCKGSKDILNNCFIFCLFIYFRKLLLLKFYLLEKEDRARICLPLCSFLKCPWLAGSGPYWSQELETHSWSPLVWFPGCALAGNGNQDWSQYSHPGTSVCTGGILRGISTTLPKVYPHILCVTFLSDFRYKNNVEFL